MPLKKVKRGSNMYQGWVTHTHSLLDGRCLHECSYCYVQAMAKRYPLLAERYSGDIRLRDKELAVNYGKDNAIFIEHCSDLFAANVPDKFIIKILAHCREYQSNTYIFQTKNPSRYCDFLDEFPKNTMIGTTIETNRDIIGVSRAPHVRERYYAIKELTFMSKFITIEPILDFDVEELSRWIKEINPCFVNIGADSKGHHLIEPTMEKIHALIEKLQEYGVEVKEKHNIGRLTGE